MGQRSAGKTLTVQQLVEILFTCDPDAKIVLHEALDEAQGTCLSVKEIFAHEETLPGCKGDNVLAFGDVKEGEKIVVLSTDI